MLRDNAYVTGDTSTNFQLQNPLANTGPSTNRDAFVSELNPAGTDSFSSTRLGGNGNIGGGDKGFAIASTGWGAFRGRQARPTPPTSRPSTRSSRLRATEVPSSTRSCRRSPLRVPWVAAKVLNTLLPCTHPRPTRGPAERAVRGSGAPAGGRRRGPSLDSLAARSLRRPVPTPGRSRRMPPSLCFLYRRSPAYLTDLSAPTGPSRSLSTNQLHERGRAHARTTPSCRSPAPARSTS